MTAVAAEPRGHAAGLRGARYAAALLAVTCVYFLSGKLGFSFAFATQQVTAVWPPTGIAVSALVLVAPRMWPAIAAGAFAINAASSEPVLTALGIAVGNTLGPVAGAAILRRVGFDAALGRVRDVGSLLVAAVCVAFVKATAGVAHLVLGGVVPFAMYAAVWPVWWVGDAMGVLLLAPALMTCARMRAGVPGHRRMELVAFACVALTASVVVLSRSGFQYLLYPAVLWTALRFSQRETALTVLAIAAIAIEMAIRGRGPFASGSLDHRLVQLELFMAVTTITGLVLGALTAERRTAIDALEQAHRMLDDRVRERTEALSAANRELVDVNARLTTQARDLAQKNEEVEAFVYIVSHDLRAPLVNLQGFSSELDASCRELDTALRTQRLDPEVEEAARRILDTDVPTSMRYIRASATKFQRLIDALLALSRLGRMPHRTERVDLGELARFTVDSVRRSVDERGAVVDVGALPAAMGDVTSLGQVIANLTENALTYLEPGRPGRVEIGGERDGPMVHCWVRDNGVGIPEGARPRLFQVFQRFHPSMADGEGMGLAIVKRVVERHGGRVWVESVEGSGATFHLTIPAADGDERGADRGDA